MISTIKQYLYIGLGLLVTGLMVAVKILTGRNSRLKQKVEVADKQIKHQIKVMETDKEVELEHDVRTEELRDEIKKNGTSSELSDPNKW